MRGEEIVTVPIPEDIRMEISKFSQGSWAARRVCEELYQKFGEGVLSTLNASGLRGLAIWFLYFNDCRGDLDAMKAEIDNRLSHISSRTSHTH